MTLHYQQGFLIHKRTWKFTFLFFSLFIASLAKAEVTGLDQCRTIPKGTQHNQPVPFAESLLWKLQKEGVEDSYLFGTIHVTDPRVLKLPESILERLYQSEFFVMELAPDSTDVSTYRKFMFYQDGQLLTDLLDKPFFQATADILEKYHYTSDYVNTMKPWAAYLIMNYPVGDGEFLDIKLMQLAEEQKLEIIGLETAAEQLSIFNNLNQDEQLQLLLDSVCHYEELQSNFDTIIELYLQGDLQGLFRFNSIMMPEEKLYQALLNTILYKRNKTMTQRLENILKQGSAFIAVGAMHLPGKDGLLSLLKQQGYNVSPL